MNIFQCDVAKAADFDQGVLVVVGEAILLFPAGLMQNRFNPSLMD